LLGLAEQADSVVTIANSTATAKGRHARVPVTEGVMGPKYCRSPSAAVASHSRRETPRPTGSR
jgi:hypothetical protein